VARSIEFLQSRVNIDIKLPTSRCNTALSHCLTLGPVGNFKLVARLGLPPKAQKRDHALQPQHSGLFDHELDGESLQKPWHVQPEPLLPRQAALCKSVGTKWHQAGTDFVADCRAAKKAVALSEPLVMAGAVSEALHPQHSGLFDHELDGVSSQKPWHVQPEALLPRQATLWNSLGTKWHHAGTDLTVVLLELPVVAGAFSEALQAQHSGLFDQELKGVSLQKPWHVQPDALLPWQATLCNSAGTKRHQAGTALADNLSSTAPAALESA